jgi:hypothetical protein
MKTCLAKELAHALHAMRNCQKVGNKEWEEKHSETLKELQKYLPSGSGLDAGTSFDQDKSTDDKLVFHTQFHHMNEDGSYTHWSEHTIIIRPANFVFGPIITVSGEGGKGDHGDYIAETFREILFKEYIATTSFKSGNEPWRRFYKKEEEK